MADITDFARELADTAKRNLSSLGDKQKLQLHRARVLDAESQPFWRDVKENLVEGIKAYDSEMCNTAVEELHSVAQGPDYLTVVWRYPQPQQLSVKFDFERRLITAVKSNTGRPGEAKKELHLQVDSQDAVFVSDQNVQVGGPVGAAKAILKFMLAELVRAAEV